ncbi:carboxypeptidase-like regulatory domain-containing protein [Olivibacter sp. XZL3]|uniref:TonB-dependent receptor n=1 Tax=Olivibacter sp. XZL3 TaxID=1735116 RepID=UPI0010655E2C|nr:carboxypeptidase-like regulatory domain-containing protein [Olivibacter sp. XZL3]
MKIRVKYEIEQQHRLIALFFLWIMVLSCLTTQAQENILSIKGAVYSDMGEGLPFASITLKTAKEDDKPFKGVFSNDTGSFELSGLPAGTYYFLVSMVGYKALEREIRLENDIALGKLVLATDATMLGEVTINAHPKVVERQADRFVMNVGGSTFQTSSVMEIFMAMPFMQVQGEQIVINGKRNILVLVDNVPIPGVTLKDVLNTMNGSDIDKIDFITNPSARYDASVDAVISIHTKRALAQGLTGRLNGTYSRGNYGRGNVGLNLTYRKKKMDGRWALQL